MSRCTRAIAGAVGLAEPRCQQQPNSGPWITTPQRLRGRRVFGCGLKTDHRVDEGLVRLHYVGVRRKPPALLSASAASCESFHLLRCSNAKTVAGPRSNSLHAIGGMRMARYQNVSGSRVGPLQPGKRMNRLTEKLNMTLSKFRQIRRATAFSCEEQSNRS